MQTLPRQFQVTEWYPWQQNLIQEFEKEPDIHFVYDPVGNTGKTTLAVNMRLTGKAGYITAGQSFPLLLKQFHNTPDQKIYFFDFPRAVQVSPGFNWRKFSQFFWYLKNIKRAHVVVFSAVSF
jgi:hypothetical protein